MGSCSRPAGRRSAGRGVEGVVRVALSRRGAVRVRALADPGPDAAGRRLVWLASGEEGFPLGAAFLRLPDRGGRREPGELDVQVHPAERRRGVGSLLLEAAVEAARRDGRGAVVAEARTASAGPGGAAGSVGAAGSGGGASVGAVPGGGPAGPVGAVGAVPGAGGGDAGFVEAGAVRRPVRSGMRPRPVRAWWTRRRGRAGARSRVRRRAARVRWTRCRRGRGRARGRVRGRWARTSRADGPRRARAPRAGRAGRARAVVRRRAGRRGNVSCWRTGSGAFWR
ncbi:GNAT family N-acetyltransferase [Actinomadura yumaensis]|uniref:GNAT family N-acetyltransferase n=1 Tax=Actinomadura yumaensis TaxID=111807 RepID=UPI0036069E74